MSGQVITIVVNVVLSVTLLMKTYALWGCDEELFASTNGQPLLHNISHLKQQIYAIANHPDLKLTALQKNALLHHLKQKFDQQSTTLLQLNRSLEVIHKIMLLLIGSIKEIEVLTPYFPVEVDTVYSQKNPQSLSAINPSPQSISVVVRHARSRDALISMIIEDLVTFIKTDNTAVLHWIESLDRILMRYQPTQHRGPLAAIIGRPVTEAQAREVTRLIDFHRDFFYKYIVNPRQNARPMIAIWQYVLTTLPKQEFSVDEATAIVNSRLFVPAPRTIDVYQNIADQEILILELKNINALQEKARQVASRFDPKFQFLIANTYLREQLAHLDYRDTSSLNFLSYQIFPKYLNVKDLYQLDKLKDYAESLLIMLIHLQRIILFWEHLLVKNDQNLKLYSQITDQHLSAIKMAVPQQITTKHSYINFNISPDKQLYLYQHLPTLLLHPKLGYFAKEIIIHYCELVTRLKLPYDENLPEFVKDLLEFLSDL